ncbi:MAG: transposase zinc-binding domain-containing protein [bacterium]
MSLNIEEGFARLRCPDCEREMVVTFSCKQRGFCPSCHQKRSLELSEHLNENVYKNTIILWIDFLDCRLFRHFNEAFSFT